MTEATITSTFVSQVAPIGFADAAGSADRLEGSELSAGSARLQVKERIGAGLAGAAWYEGVLHTGSRLFPSVRVDIVVSPWSAGRSEIGLRPLTRIGRIDSFRANRFFAAAWAILPRLMEELGAGRPAEAPAHAGLVAA